VVAIYYGALGVALLQGFKPAARLRRFAIFTAVACGAWIVIAPADVLPRKRDVLRVTFSTSARAMPPSCSFPAAAP
jgi:hypothetical protein